MNERALTALIDGHAARAGRPPAAVLVHAPDTAGVAHHAPAPAVAGVPVAVVPRSAFAHRSAPRADGAPLVHAVLAMWKASYLSWGERLVHAFGAAGSGARVEWWPATDVLREQLCTRLATGPDVVIYVGHGRERGWTGYRGVRMQHVLAHAPERPVGALLAFTCRNLLPTVDGEPSFGEGWVTSGRARAFLGAVDAVRVEPLEQIGRHLEALLATASLHTLADLVRALDARLRAEDDFAVLEAWRSFRVVGHPLLPVFRREASGRMPLPAPGADVGAVAQLELVQDVVHVVLDGGELDLESSRDLLVGEALLHQ